jgi:branched-chain amino acid transport system ATP-binding protein
MMTYAHRHLSFSEVQDKAYAQFPILGDRRHQIAGTLSGGQQQMVAIARAIVTDPVLILVDELSMGLAPLIVRELYDILHQLAEDGTAILLVEQFARTALAFANYAAIMVQGRILAVGQPEDLGDVAAAYLGGAA